MKRLFCRPYGTNPGVHVLCPSSELLGYYQLSLAAMLSGQIEALLPSVALAI